MSTFKTWAEEEQAGDALKHLQTAARNNELRDLVAVPDRKSQAAGDDTFDFMRS